MTRSYRGHGADQGCTPLAFSALQASIKAVVDDLQGVVILELPRSSVDRPQIGRW
ncbi:MAG TPA: hypothetical protein VJ608_14050 [Albitalea sp.]|nr:hypothetical protein [Albitalea sp.]